MTEAKIIDGKAIAQSVRDDVKRQVVDFRERTGGAPGLATVLVGDDPASQIYVANKHRACEEVGIRSLAHQPSAEISEQDLLDLIAELNADPEVHGFIVQLPLPSHLDAATVAGAIDPRKDVDGLSPTNAGLLVQGRTALAPATPVGVMELLRRSEVRLDGAEAVVVGRSELVGRPVASLLLQAHATVTICHSHTPDLGEVCRRGDVLVVAAGRPALVGADMVKPGATVIDVGTNRTEGGLVGDVDFDSVRQVAGALTPVPGGVGPMTIAMLLRNTLVAARSGDPIATARGG